MHMRFFPALALALAALLALSPVGAALAADGAGNEFSTSESGVGSPKADRDFVWVGESARFTDIDVGSDLLLAGQGIVLSGGKAGGSIRAAAQTLAISGVKAKGNVTAAAQTVVIDGKSKMAGAYVAAQDVRIGGNAAAVMAVAETVEFDGTVEGDVYVRAENVRFNPGTRIEGTAYVASPNQPYIDPASDVASIKFTQVEHESIDGESIAGIAGALPGASILFGLVALMSLVVCTLVAGALAPRMGERASALFARRTGAFIGAGILCVLLAPPVAVALCLLVATLPLGVALLAVIAAGPVVAPIVTAIGLGRLCFPKMGRLASSALWAAILGVLMMFPVVKWVVRFAALVFATGYAWMAVLQRRKEGASTGPSPQQPFSDTGFGGYGTGPVPPQM